jgi:hypothetical protein
MILALLLVHGILAVVLLGAITHQAFAASTTRPGAGRGSFVAKFRNTDAASYSRVVVALFVAIIFLGSILYPSYRLVVRPLLQAQDLRAANGVFEIKEHFSALALLLLPAYWAVWRQPLSPEYASARVGLTWVLASMVWWNFIIGQLLVSIKGLFL